jgi:hypothetical protein
VVAGWSASLCATRQTVSPSDHGAVSSIQKLGILRNTASAPRRVSGKVGALQLYVSRPFANSTYWQSYPQDTSVPARLTVEDSMRIRLIGPIKLEPIVVIK